MIHRHPVQQRAVCKPLFLIIRAQWTVTVDGPAREFQLAVALRLEVLPLFAFPCALKRNSLTGFLSLLRDAGRFNFLRMPTRAAN